MNADKRRKFRISGKTVFNLAVLAIMVYLIVYFFVSENGMIDLLSTPGSFSVFWLIIALLVHNSNILIDALVTLILLRDQYPRFRLIDAVKLAFVGNFFGAITPSSTGGQPMQLYLISKMGVRVGFASACLTQKFTVFQILNTVFSIAAVILRFDYFSVVLKDFWTTAFFALGFASQLLATSLFLSLSYSERITNLIMKIVFKLLRKLRFIKNRERIIDKVKTELELFHCGNKGISRNRRIMAKVYPLVALQIIAVLIVPYFIYISFDMPAITAAAGGKPASVLDFLCLQSFVTFTSNLVLLPGASGGAELAFTMYFSSLFIVGSVNKIKPAVLLWRFVGYYASIVISFPFTYFTKDRRKELLKAQAENDAL